MVPEITAGTDGSIEFNIGAWQAWTSDTGDKQPDVSVIPPMLRRRLTPLGRAALSVAIPLMAGYEPMPLVYVSRHGDMARTLGLLEDLAKNEPLSPTAFSLSVHNATAGLYSIHQKLTENIISISGGQQSLIPALMESLGLCSAGAQRVACVFCDAPLPEIYLEEERQPENMFALGLILTPGSDWKLTPVSASPSVSDAHSSHQALALLDMFESGGTSLQFEASGMRWQLQRSVG